MKKLKSDDTGALPDCEDLAENRRSVRPSGSDEAEELRSLGDDR